MNDELTNFQATVLAASMVALHALMTRSVSQVHANDAPKQAVAVGVAIANELQNNGVIK